MTVYGAQNKVKKDTWSMDILRLVHMLFCNISECLLVVCPRFLMLESVWRLQI